MKQKLVLLLLLLPLSASLATVSAAPNTPETKEQSEELSPAAILAAQVKDIAASDTLSREAQAKQISSAVRLSIIASTEGINSPEDRLKIAAELATAATKAAPHFAATITSAVADIPFIAKIDGALEQIQAAVSTAIESAEETSIANPAVNPPRPANPEFGGPNKGETIVSPAS